MKPIRCPWCGETMALKLSVTTVPSLSKPIKQPHFCAYCDRPFARVGKIGAAYVTVPTVLMLPFVLVFGWSSTGYGGRKAARELREFLTKLFGPSWLPVAMIAAAVMIAGVAVSRLIAVRRAKLYRLVPGPQGYQIAKIPTQLTVEVPRRLPVSGGGILPVDLPQEISEAAEPALFFTRSVEPSSRGCYIYRCGFLGYDGVDFSRIRPGMTFTVLLDKGETVTATVRTARAPSEDDYADERRALEPSNP